MIVDHVQNYAQTHSVYGLDHLPEVCDSGRPVGVSCIAAIRNAIVHWVVSPVESILISYSQYSPLLLFTVC